MLVICKIVTLMHLPVKLFLWLVNDYNLYSCTLIHMCLMHLHLKLFIQYTHIDYILNIIGGKLCFYKCLWLSKDLNAISKG